MWQFLTGGLEMGAPMARPADPHARLSLINAARKEFAKSGIVGATNGASSEGTDNEATADVWTGGPNAG